MNDTEITTTTTTTPEPEVITTTTTTTTTMEETITTSTESTGETESTSTSTTTTTTTPSVKPTLETLTIKTFKSDGETPLKNAKLKIFNTNGKYEIIKKEEEIDLNTNSLDKVLEDYISE